MGRESEFETAGKRSPMAAPYERQIKIIRITHEMIHKWE
jgi:hypothetical protein